MVSNFRISLIEYSFINLFESERIILLNSSGSWVHLEISKIPNKDVRPPLNRSNLTLYNFSESIWHFQVQDQF